MKNIIGATLAIGMFFSMGDWACGQCMNGNCFAFEGTTQTCDDGGTYHDCSFPNCSDFRVKGPDFGFQWANVQYIFGTSATGYEPEYGGTFICSYWGNCVITTPDPNVLEYHVCERENAANWNFMPRYFLILNTDLPCCLD